MFKKLILVMALLGMGAFPAGAWAAEAAAGAGAGASAQSQPEAAADEKGPGLMDLQVNEAIWVIAIFIILLIVLYPTAWKSVLAGLKAREERIRKDIEDAETARSRAEQTLGQYNEQLAAAESKVREMIGAAAAEGERVAANIRMRAQQESEEIKERANKEIEATRDRALSEIYERTAQLATSVAEKILRRNLNAEDQRDLVNRSLEQMQAIGEN